MSNPKTTKSSKGKEPALVPQGECPICISSYNTGKYCAIRCERCPFTCCLSCCQYYLLDLQEEPHCMDCRTPWSRMFIYDNFPSSWITGGLKNHREDILMAEERTLLPETLPLVEKDLKIKAVMEHIRPLQSQRSELKREFEQLTTNMREMRNKYFTSVYSKDSESEKISEEEFNKQVQYISERKSDIMKIRLKLKEELRPYKYQHYQLLHPERFGIRPTPEEKEERRQFIKPCPGEGCRGFLSSRWRCGLCGINVCNQCHEIMPSKKEGSSSDGAGPSDGGHICKEENIETVKMLEKDSKPCPKCGVLIFKIHGCDQMWCTSCNSPWSWRTGKIITGAIHNPHFFDWQKRTGARQEVVLDPYRQCGQNPLYDCQIVFEQFGERRYPVFMGFFQSLGHIYDGYVRHGLNFGRGIQANQDLRIKYLEKEVDDAKWKKLLQMRQKRRHKETDLRNVLEMLVLAGGDILRRLKSELPIQIIQFNRVGYPITPAQFEKLDQFETEIRNLCAYVEEQLNRIGEMYQSVYHKPILKYLKENVHDKNTEK